MHILRLLLAAFLPLLLLATKAQALETGWVIDQFHSRITVGENASVTVEEIIIIDFNSLDKHGIFRTIPINYRDRFGNKVNIRLSVESIADELGRERKFKTKRRGKNIEIKIGDPGKTISGVQNYVIRYTVNRVITRFDEHDELYWNVTGNTWPVTIRQASANVLLPANANNATCFSGAHGSSFKNCTIDLKENAVEFRSNTSLRPGSGLTIVTAVPKGVIRVPPLTSRLWWLISDNWPFAIPFVTLVVLLWLYWQHGRDERYKSLFDPSRGTERLPLFTAELIPSTYAPLKDIKPAEAGTLIDEEVNIRDIAATIVDLAVRGYVRIEEITKGALLKKQDFKLVWTDQDTTNLEEFENLLLVALFGKTSTDKTVKLSQLKYKFHAHLKKIRDSLYDSMKKEGYFLRRPDKVVQTYRIIGAVIAFLGVFFFAFSLAWSVGVVGSGIVILLFAKTMPKRTAKGRKHYLRVAGLRNFINVGAYRQELWEKANLFEEVMPHAIALNLTHQWAEAFEKINVPKPDWFKGTTPFNPAMFSYSMENFTRATTQTLPATRSAASGSSGFSGGFSGGGFGGGGGGSW